MKIWYHWKIICTLCAIVVVSFLAGSLMGDRHARVEMRSRFDPAHWNEYAMQTLNRKLRLKPDQQARIQKVIDQAVEEMKVVHRNTTRETGEIVDRLLANIERELTPEQRKIAETLAPSDNEVTIDLLKVKPRKE